MIAAEKAVFHAKAALDKARRKVEPLELPDYELTRPDGKPLRLSDAFGKRRDLLVVHNMGARCPMCTMWADGFSGLADHLQDRAGFLLTSPDAPKALKAFAKARGWRFPVASTAGTTFARHLGFEDAEGHPWPGVSALHRTEDGRILRVGTSAFGPGDDFCATFALLDLLADGQADWWPKLAYGKRASADPGAPPAVGARGRAVGPVARAGGPAAGVGRGRRRPRARVPLGVRTPRRVAARPAAARRRQAPRPPRPARRRRLLRVERLPPRAPVVARA